MAKIFPPVWVHFDAALEPPRMRSGAAWRRMVGPPDNESEAPMTHPYQEQGIPGLAHELAALSAQIALLIWLVVCLLTLVGGVVGGMALAWLWGG